MRMPLIEWHHNHQRLLLSIVVMAPLTAANPNLSVRTTGLIDTGATGTGVRPDLADALALRAKGQRRVHTANGMIMAPEFLIRIGFVCGDYRDPNFVPDQQQPYVLEDQYLGFGLQSGFPYPVLIGMDILGNADLALHRNGEASLRLY